MGWNVARPSRSGIYWELTLLWSNPVTGCDTIHCAITITKIAQSGHAEAEAFFTNQDNEQVCYTHLTGRIPLTQERELLKQMINEDDPTNKLSNEKYTG